MNTFLLFGLLFGFAFCFDLNHQVHEDELNVMRNILDENNFRGILEQSRDEDDILLKGEHENNQKKRDSLLEDLMANATKHKRHSKHTNHEENEKHLKNGKHEKHEKKNHHFSNRGLKGKLAHIDEELQKILTEMD
jgi:hypothetical protein